MRHAMSKLFALALLLVIPALMCAQEVASVTGTVTDTTGAVVPGVSVKLVNTRTNTTYETTTNPAGYYTIAKVLPGPSYKITFKRDGFETFSVSDLYLVVGATRTQNAQMQVGKVNETVDVSAQGQGVALNTSDASVGNNFDMNSVAQLPVQIRDSPAALLQLQPGVVNATGGSDGLSSRAGAVTGARGDQNSVTLDGLDVNDFATGQAFATVANAPVESIQEFRGETAGSLAASGRGSGGQIQMVTKGGSNQWHGSAADYNRIAATAANSWFNNLNMPGCLQRAGSNEQEIKKCQTAYGKPPLVRNQFSGTLSGPIVKDKLFFFFNYNGRRDAQSVSTYNTVPLDSFRAGNISYIKATDSTGAPCSASSRANTTPDCIGTLTPAQIVALDPKSIGVDAALLSFVNSRYPQANDLTVGDGVNTGGFRFSAPSHRKENDYVTRIDYNMNSSMKLFGRFSIQRDFSDDTVNYSAPYQFPCDPVTHAINNTSYAYVIGHTWSISSTKVNQFTYGETVSQLDFPTNYNPMGTTVWSFGGLTAPYSSQSAQARKIPIPVFRDDFTWQRGNHNIQFGGTFKPIKTTSNLISDYNYVGVGIGGLNTQLTAALRPADILDNFCDNEGNCTDPNKLAISRWDSLFTFDLGRLSSISTRYNYNNSLSPLELGTGAHRSYKYNELETYWQDSWKVNPGLTLTYGLRYQYYSVPYETKGFQATQNFAFDEYLFGRAATGLTGVYGNTAVPMTYYNLAGKANNARGLYEPNLTNFAPRFSFAYTPSATNGLLGKIFGDRKTVIRGGSGVIYDHPVVNALNFIQDQNSYMFQATTNIRYGASTAAAALANDPRFTSIDSIPNPLAAPTIARPYAPYTTNGIPTGAANSQFNYAIDPNLKAPYSIALNFGIQRELPHHFVLESTYVGRLGRRLIAQADAAQLVEFKDPTANSGLLMSAAFANLERQIQGGADWSTVTPIPFFENLVPGTSQLGYPSATSFVTDYFGNLVAIGDIADSVQGLASFYSKYGKWGLPRNIGMPAQFAGDTYITNKGSSVYHGLLTTLHRNMNHGLQFDINYTFSHSIDNSSGIANSISSSSGMGFICDAQNLRICRGNSDFDITHIINGTFIYELPFGKGKAFGSTALAWMNQVIGGWTVSGIPTWRTGIAFSTVSNAFLMGYANDAPALFNGDTNAVKVGVHKLSDGTINLFANPDAAVGAFSNPIAFEMGSRNNLRGPGFFNLDMGLSKRFPVTERVNMIFRADAFNVLNHPSFGLPGGGAAGSGADVTSGVFGQITGTASTARVMQWALRLEF